jgi:hypothetical protein
METRDDFRGPGAGQGSGMGQGMKEEARGVAARARETSGRLANRAWSQADQAVRGRKDTAAQRLDSISGALRDGAHRLSGAEDESLGRYATRAADGVERAARYLREHDPEDLVREVEGFARRRPELFVGSAFVTGILVARFLKASAERRLPDPTAGSEEHLYGMGGGRDLAGTSVAGTGVGPGGRGLQGSGLGTQSGPGTPRDASPDDFEDSATNPRGPRIGG